MKVYVAGKWEQRGLIADHIRELKIRGLSVTHNWTIEDDRDLEGETKERYLRVCAEDSLEGVRRADVVVVFHHPDGQGLFVEVGAALAWGRPVLVLGAGMAGPKPVFYHLPEVKLVGYWAQVLAILAEMEEQHSRSFNPVAGYPE